MNSTEDVACKSTYTCLTQSKNEVKDQEMKQSSTTPDPGYHMGKYNILLIYSFINKFIYLFVYLFFIYLIIYASIYLFSDSAIVYVYVTIYYALIRPCLVKTCVCIYSHVYKLLCIYRM